MSSSTTTQTAAAESFPQTPLHARGRLTACDRRLPSCLQEEQLCIHFVTNSAAFLLITIHKQTLGSRSIRFKFKPMPNYLVFGRTQNKGSIDQLADIPSTPRQELKIPIDQRSFNQKRRRSATTCCRSVLDYCHSSTPTQLPRQFTVRPPLLRPSDPPPSPTASAVDTIS